MVMRIYLGMRNDFHTPSAADSANNKADGLRGDADQKLAAELLVCDCEGTMKIDADGIASGLGCAGSATAFTQLCRRALGAFKDRLGADQPMIVACTQEAPLFSEIAAEAEQRTAPLSFVNIRESAGWSTDTASKTAKMAALIAAAAVLFDRRDLRQTG